MANLRLLVLQGLDGTMYVEAALAHGLGKEQQAAAAQGPLEARPAERWRGFAIR